MGEDISRSSFNPAKRYSAVRQQQGRVQLDADWNEQIDIAAHRLGTETRDIIGNSGVPRDAAGFGITVPDPTAGFTGADLAISPGRIYVAGQICELASAPVAIENFTGDGTAAAGTQVQLAGVIVDGAALQAGQWVQITAQGNPAPAARLVQITAANAAAGSVTFSSSVAAFGGTNTSPQLQRFPTYLTQPDLPSAPALPTSGNAIVYLDVWERTIDGIDDPSIQEVALGGADTTTRTRTVWQVKVLALPAGTTAACSTPDAEISAWSALIQPSGALLTNGVLPPSNSGPCSLSAGGGYTGIENQLYRVEIHQPGTLAGTAGPFTYPLTAGTATFKWSRDNASVTTGVTAITASSSSVGSATSQLTVQSTGRDAVLGFSAGQWIEITDDVLASSGLPGELHQIDLNGVDTTRSTITLTTSVSSALQGRLSAGSTVHTRIRRWDQGGKVFQTGTGNLWIDLNGTGSTGDIPVAPPGTSLVLENGITVSFTLSSSTSTLRTGDAWKFAARTATGSIESLVQAPPSAIQHHYCRLGTISFDANPWAISDCRQIFSPLAERGIHVTSVSLTSSGQNLLNDSTITVQQLATGISIACDGALDPASVTQPSNTPGANTVALSSAQATCFLGVGMPMVSSAAIFGFQQLLLGATVTLDTTQTTIHWLPTASVITGLVAQMTAIATQLTPNTPVASLNLPTLLAHLTLKGDAIWSLTDANTYLDGETLGAPYLDANGVQRTGLLLPSGDGRPGGDFAMWFWLQSPPAPPPLTASVTALSFVPTPVNVAGLPQTVTLTNNTAAAIPVTIASSGDFSETTTCGATIPANGSCLVSVVFKPTQPGARSGALTITSGTTNVPVALTGTGVAFQLSAIPTSIDFGNATVGTTSTPQTVTITNNGAATTPIVITGVGTASSAYSHSTTCSSLAAGQSCTISIQFLAPTVGAHPDSLTVNTTPAGLLAPISLNGTGTQPKNETKDTNDSKNIRDNKIIKDKGTGHPLEQIVRPVAFTTVQQATLPIEAATAKAFIQPEERPAVGQTALEEPKEPEK